MDRSFFLYALVICLAAALALISVWAPRKLWIKVTAVAIAALFMPLSYAAITDLLSRPKPVSLEWMRRSTPEAVLLGANLQDGKGIYLWLQLDGSTEPRAYRLPWNDELARQLYESQNRAEATGIPVYMRKPFERHWNEMDPKFYPEPQKPPPAKHVARQNPFMFAHPSERP